MIAGWNVYVRMVRWCQAQTVIEGTRTITHDPLGAEGERERGEIDAEGFDGQEWLGDNVGQVIDLMNDSLGAVDDEAYRIVE